MLTGFELPVSFKLMVQSMVPLFNCPDKILRMSNSKGFKKAGIFNCSSNCFPLRDLISIRKVLSPRFFSTLPKPVIDLSMYCFLIEVKVFEFTNLQRKQL